VNSLKANGALVVDGPSAVLTVKRTAEDANGTSTSRPSRR
jgi:hypothetical protein